MKITGKTLEDLLPQLSDEWYEQNEGIYYDRVETFGPPTPIVTALMGASGSDGDIVSWDTRDSDPANHRYLLRRWVPAHAERQPEHDFYLAGADDRKIQRIAENLRRAQ